jgi:hypothetical protein
MSRSANNKKNAAQQQVPPVSPFPPSLNSLVIRDKTPPHQEGGRRVRLVDGVGGSRGRTAPLPPTSRQTSLEASRVTSLHLLQKAQLGTETGNRFLTLPPPPPRVQHGNNQLAREIYFGHLILCSGGGGKGGGSGPELLGQTKNIIVHGGVGLGQDGPIGIA